MNKDSVINLTPVLNRPDEDVVRALQEWLELARSGELRSVCLTGERRSEGTHFMRFETAGHNLPTDAPNQLGQHIFNLRMEVWEDTQDATPVDIPDEEEGDVEP